MAQLASDSPVLELRDVLIQRVPSFPSLWDCSAPSARCVELAERLKLLWHVMQCRFRAWLWGTALRRLLTSGRP